MTVNENDIVYHYCSVDTFLSIIQNSKLWLSDVLKSNDAQEYYWIREKINDEITACLSTDQTALDIWDAFQKVSLNTITSRIHTASFSECGDSLSQWRGYGDNGKGIAIGFSRTHLQALSDDKHHIITFDKIKYTEQEQKKFIKTHVRKTMHKLQFKQVKHVAVELDINHSLEFPLYKNPSFYEEKEWRIVYLTSPQIKKADLPNERFPSSFAWVNKFKFYNSKFRGANGKIISYVEMDFDSIKRDIVKSIYIGPKAKVSQEDIKKVLFVNGYYEGLDPDTGMPIEFGYEKPIPIEHSISSYR